MSADQPLLVLRTPEQADAPLGKIKPPPDLAKLQRVLGGLRGLPCLS
jgi:hypothetical protein